MKFLQVVLGLGLALGSAKGHAQKGKDVAIGTSIGDFADMVKESIGPELEKKGYKVRLVQFNDYVQPNIALAEGRIDANIFQHKPYLEEFAAAKGLKLTPIAQTPTAPLGIYPGRKKDLKEVQDGSTVGVPNDPTNLARALYILSDLGWIELSAQAKAGIQASTRDIAKNVKGIKIVQLEAAQLPRARQDVDFAIINGNYVMSSGIGLDKALTFEKSEAHLNWAVVRTKDADGQFAKDLKAVLESAEFKTYTRARFKGYRYPTSWK